MEVKFKRKCESCKTYFFYTKKQMTTTEKMFVWRLDSVFNKPLEFKGFLFSHFGPVIGTDVKEEIRYKIIKCPICGYGNILKEVLSPKGKRRFMIETRNEKIGSGHPLLKREIKYI